MDNPKQIVNNINFSGYIIDRYNSCGTIFKILSIKELIPYIKRIEPANAATKSFLNFK